MLRRSILAAGLALLMTSALPAQDATNASEVERTFETRSVDIGPLTSGVGAPSPGLLAEVFRVAIREKAPTATVQVGPKDDELTVFADAASQARIKGMVGTMAALPPGKRVVPAMVYVDTRRTRDGIGRYFFDREIAQVMGHLGANWLERPSREKEERTSLLIELLGVEAETDVADIGAGTGYFTFPIARKAEDGTVYAVDIQPEMLEFIEARKRHESIENVTGVLGTITDTALPANSIDLAFAVDAYHEFSNPLEMLQSIRRALRPGGRLVLVEFRLEDPDVPIKRLHKMSQAQARKELEANGFEWVRTDDRLPRQHVLVFRKATKPQTD
jgi:SAM-dependent methyltransferase